MSQNSNNQSEKKYGRRHSIEWVILVAIVVILGAIVFLSIEARQDDEAVENQQATTEEEVVSEEVVTYPDLHSEYSSLAEDTVVERVPGEEAVETLSEGTGVVFLGFPECPWCQGLMPIVNQAAVNAGLEEVKYLDIRQSRQEGGDIYQSLIDILEDHLAVGDDGQPRIFVPDVTVVQDGEVIFRYESEDVPEGENTPDTYWTEDRTERVRMQLETEFAKVS